MGRIIGMTLKCSFFSIHRMQTFSHCANPEYAPAVFKNGAYPVINKGKGIFWIVQVAGEFSGFKIKPVEPSLFIRIKKSLMIRSTYPQRAPVIFIQHLYAIATEGCCIVYVLLVAGKSSRLHIHPV